MKIIAKALGTTVENLVYTSENQEEKEDEKNPPPTLQEIFVQLPDNDRKSVMALVEEMFSHMEASKNCSFSRLL